MIKKTTHVWPVTPSKKQGQCTHIVWHDVSFVIGRDQEPC